MTLNVQNMLTRLSSAGTSTSNRYAVQLILPTALKASDYTIGGNTLSDTLNFYCDSITTPTKQITTAQHRDHGVGINYPTGTVYGEVTINMLSPANLDFNKLFESWYALMHNDYGNTVAYYDDIVSPKLTIYKLEKGGISNETKLNTKVTGRWEIENALPYNISPYQLSSGRTQLLKLRVSFKFERYRFYQGGSIGLLEELF